MQTLTHPVNFICAWSGGKDACLALYKMQQWGHSPQALLTMMNESGQLSRAHHLPKALIEQQAAALQISCLTQATSKQDYQNKFQRALQTLKQQALDYLVLGDIDLQPHRDWHEQQGNISGVTPLFPLWLGDHRALVNEFIEAGFKATIIAILPDKLPPDFLGKPFNHQTLLELENLGVDVCAEGGEFHTFVTDGPIFSQPIPLNLQDAKHCNNGEYGYHYLDFS